MSTPNAPSVAEVEAGARAYVQWINPAHSTRAPTEQDRQRVRAVLKAAWEHHDDVVSRQLERSQDLVHELRRQIAGLDRALQRSRQAAS